MELLAAYIIAAAILVAPSAVWVYARKDRWRRPRRAVGVAYLAIIALEMILVGTSGMLYPFGFPGPEERAWRAAAVECGTKYAAAHTSVDSDAVDSYVHHDD